MLRKLSIRLREAEARIAELQAGGARPAARSSNALGRATHAAPPACAGPRLEIEGQDLAYALSQASTLIGRFDPVTQLKPDVDLTDLDLKRTVSRQHARVIKGSDGYSVMEEAGALNGTFVNDVQLTPGQAHALRDGDRVSLGSVHLVFRS
jgi:pSer/pThr/pTyr-binding forkhead associated (FHA) protein